MKPLKIIRITFFICGIAAACVSLGYYLKIHRSGFYDIFTEGEYAKVMDWSLAIAVVCVVAFILSFVCERLEIRLDKAKATDLSIDEKTSQGAVDAKYIKYTAIRKALYEDFRGPNDVVFHRLCDDVEELVKQNPKGLRTRITEIATVLYDFKNSRDRKTAVDTKIEKNYQDWVTTFCQSFEVEPLNTLRKDDHESIQTVDGFPFRYLYAPSWKDFYNPQKLEEYLR